MTKKFTALCFLFLLSSSYCSECTEKTNLTEDEINKDICYYLKASSNEVVCRYDEDKNACYEKKCSDYEWDDCDHLNYYLDQNGEYGKSCVAKSDHSGCELISCESLTSNCERFISESEDIKCALNSEKSHCEIQKCSDLTSGCDKFIPSNWRYKCVLNEAKTQCETVSKTCEELDSDKCNYGDTYEERCLIDSTTSNCKLYKCEDLSSSECTRFEPNDQNQICAPNGNKCEIKTSCSELDKDVCETIKFRSGSSKCSYSEEKKCSFMDCYKLESNCGQFVPLDPLYKCTYDDEEESCIYDNKNCEELSAGQCDLFNIEDILEDVGKRCVEDDGKCVLNSKKLEYSILFLPLLFFLF